MILAIFDLQVTGCFLPSFMSICLSVQEKKQKIDFQDCGQGSHFGFMIGTTLAIFDLQGAATSPLFKPPLFQDTWPCVQLLCVERNAPCQ